MLTLLLKTMDVLFVLFVLLELSLGCSSTFSQREPTVEQPPADVETSGERASAHGVQEVEVIGQLGVPHLEWLGEGNVCFVRAGSQNESYLIPLIYHGGQSLTWSVQDDGAIVVDGRVIGWDLTELSLPEIERLAMDRSGTLETVVIRDLQTFDSALQSAVETLAGPRLALSVEIISNNEVVGADRLGRFGERLVGLVLRFIDGGNVDLEHLRQLPNLTGLALENATLSNLESLTSLSQLRALLIEVPYINPPPFGGDDMAVIGELSSLRRFELTGGEVRTTDLAHLTRLTGLKAFALREYPTLPLELDLETTGLAELTGLRSLDLEVTGGENGFPYIARMTNLVELGYGGGWIGAADMALLEHLSHLRRLRLYAPDISPEAMAPISRMTELRDLDLSSNMLTERLNNGHLAYLSGLRNLRALNLANTGIGEQDLTHLSGLTGLRTLDLSQTDVTSSTLSGLVGMTGLRELILDSPSVGSAGLAHLSGLTQLRTLVLAYAQIDANGLAHLSGLNELRTLDLRGTQVDDAAVEPLAALTSLREMDLTGATVTDAGLRHLAGLSRLRRLNLMGTSVGDAGMEHLAGLTELRWLNLHSTLVGDRGFTHLGRLSRLRELVLRETRVGDEALSHVAALRELRYLDLCRTQVTDAGLAHLSDIPQLHHVDLVETAVTAEAASSLRQGRPQMSVSHSGLY